MKIKTTIRKQNPKVQGFTLIEMIGVLAVIAILAAVLTPKVFEAINNARVNSTAVGIQTVKTAVVDHYGKWQSLTQNGATGQATAITALPMLRYDLMLLKEGLLEKEFSARIGDAPGDAYVAVGNGSTPTTAATRIELVVPEPPAASGANQGVVPLTASNSAYDLDGDGVNDVTGAAVVQSVITGVSLEDARALNRTIDGLAVNMGEPAGGGDDVKGRVKYAAPTGGGTTTVYVYLTHR